ncbi:unnamed protein product [Mucor fragilis]
MGIQSSCPVAENAAPTTTTSQLDPFDPSHVGKASPPAAPPSATSDAVPTATTNTLPASSQNSFIPESTKTSTSPPPRVQSAPITQHVTPKPQMATKILQTQPNSPVTKPVNEESNPAEARVDEDEDQDEMMPTINRGVSSSIEARFMAIKNASRNSNPHPVKPTATNSTPKKNKPAPPPKPARFRSQQTNQQVPTVDDFEHKFPSLEDLDKSIS